MVNQGLLEARAPRARTSAAGWPPHRGRRGRRGDAAQPALRLLRHDPRRRPASRPARRAFPCRRAGPSPSTPAGTTTGEVFWIDAEAPDAGRRQQDLSPPRHGAGHRRARSSGQVRADLYIGRGDAAGVEAGRVRHTLRMTGWCPSAWSTAWSAAAAALSRRARVAKRPLRPEEARLWSVVASTVRARPGKVPPPRPSRKSTPPAQGRRPRARARPRPNPRLAWRPVAAAATPAARNPPAPWPLPRSGPHRTRPQAPHRPRARAHRGAPRPARHDPGPGPRRAARLHRARPRTGRPRGADHHRQGRAGRRRSCAAGCRTGWREPPSRGRGGGLFGRRSAITAAKARSMWR